MNILFILRNFPKTTETFIIRELAELKKQGCKVFIFSFADFFHAPLSDQIFHEDVFQYNLLQDRYDYYLPKTKLGACLRFLRVFAFSVLQHPSKTCRALSMVVSQCAGAGVVLRSIRLYLIFHSLSQLRIDVIHASFSDLRTVQQANFFADLLSVPFTLTFRARDMYQNTDELARRKHQLLFERAAHFFTISDYNRLQLKKLFGSRKPISVIHSAVWPEKMRLPANPVKKTIDVLAIGRLIEKKGIAYLLGALHALHSRGLTVRTTVVGRGALLSELQGVCQKLKIDDLVTFEDFVTQKGIIDLLSRSTIFALPCVVAQNGDRDILPNVLKEAMAMELPVITSNISGIEELITDGENGILVPERDIDALAEAIQRLLRDASLRAKLGNAARQTVIKDFNLSVEVGKKIKIFTQIARASR